MMMRHDIILKAAFSGAAGAILANLSLYLINLFIPGQTINMPQLSVEFFLNIDDFTVLHLIMGAAWSIIVGGTYALIYLIVLEKTGWNNLWVKSIFTISSIWLLAGGFAMKVMGVGQYVREEPLSIFAFFIAHLLFATYLSLIVNKHESIVPYLDNVTLIAICWLRLQLVPFNVTLSRYGTVDSCLRTLKGLPFEGGLN